MDPCPFVRLIVESLALKLPTVSKPAGAGVHPSTTPCFCTIHLHDSLSSPQTAPLPLASSASSGDLINADSSPSPISSSATVFSLDHTVLRRLAGKPATLIISVYTGRTGSTCGLSSGRVLGRVRVAVDVDSAPSRGKVLKSGWLAVGARGRLHLVVRSEPDPRFVFQFGGEPECSPVVFQVPGNGAAAGGRSGCLRQPVFSCRFSADRRRNIRSRSLPTNPTTNWTNIKDWLGTLGSERAQHARKDQRKGWTVTIHDLSGSPVAAASMVTPFVPSPSNGNSDRVSRSNPGAWLILQPAGLSPAATTWKPWGRLEAWRERDGALGYRFEVVADGATGVLVAESAISARRGGRFCIDHPGGATAGGFVMGSTVEGEGKASRPVVEVGVQHVACMGDAALFVALAAAVDLSMDACQLFSQRLRKELCQDQEEYAL